jgi:ribosomal protein L29
MDLTINEVEEYLNFIFLGKKIFKQGDISVVFIQPDNEVKLKSGYVYSETYKKAIDEGLLSIRDIEKLIEERSLISEEEKFKLGKLKSQLEAQQLLLSKTKKVKANIDRIKTVIRDLTEDIAKIENKKYSKLALSAETKAEEVRQLFLCWASTYSYEDDCIYSSKLFWDTYKDFLNEKDTLKRSIILSNFSDFYRGIDTEIIRYIARSTLWRIRFITSQKTSEKLFGVPTSEYTNDMLNLAYWSNFYQNVYEMLPEDKPSDLIIEDDEALDAYMKGYYEERNREAAAKRSKASRSGKLSAFDSEEVIVTQSNELYQDIEYDKPKESGLIKDRADVRKRVRRVRK